MKKIVEKIIQKRVPCYFISPHLDDAILSCGGLLRYLSGKTNVSVLTVFTEADDKFQTLSARAFLKQCGFSDAKELFKRRREEDKRVLDSIGVSFEHLGFFDALWRKKEVGNILKVAGKLFPELIHIYPTYRFQITSGKVNGADDKIMLEIKNKINSIIKKEQQSLTFFPIGLGNHVDHVLTHRLGLSFSQNAIFYSDFPYCLSDRKGEAVLEKKGFIGGEFDQYLVQKNSLIKMYETQPLFSADPPITPETYYYSKDLIDKI